MIGRILRGFDGDGVKNQFHSKSLLVTFSRFVCGTYEASSSVLSLQCLWIQMASNVPKTSAGKQKISILRLVCKSVIFDQLMKWVHKTGD